VFVAQQDSLLEKFQASSIFVLFTKITERVNAEFLGSCTIERLWALESLLCLAIKQITHYYPKIQNLEAIFPCEPYDNNNAERYQTLLTEIQNNIADLRAHDLKQFIIDNDLIHIWGLSIFSHNMSEHYYDLEEWDSFFLRNLEAISVEYDVLTQQSSRPFLFNHSGLAPLRAETKTSDYENPSTKLGYY
jgi:hypothetical protein